MSEFWRTSISQVKSGEIMIRGYPIEQLTRKRSFGDVVFLLLTGELPPGREGDMIEAILVSCCDHSLASPSVDAVRFVASSGVPLQTAVAAGVSSIGEVHGGAIEPCAHLLRKALEAGQTADDVMAELRAGKRRLPGFGHAVHKVDPRATVLLDIAAEWGVSGAYTAFARSLEVAAEKALGRPLPMNVDGAVAALMCDMGIDPALGKSFFIIGRAPGYVAHAYEQVTAERPFKAASPEEITYTGPALRDVPDSAK